MIKSRITYDLCMYRIRSMNLSLSKKSNLIKEKKSSKHFNPIKKESNSMDLDKDRFFLGGICNNRKFNERKKR